jgi:hypothetical protein
MRNGEPNKTQGRARSRSGLGFRHRGVVETTVSSKHHQEVLASTFAHFNSSDTGLATADAAALRDVMALGGDDEALLSVGTSATPLAFLECALLDENLPSMPLQAPCRCASHYVCSSSAGKKPIGGCA